MCARVEDAVAHVGVPEEFACPSRSQVQRYHVQGSPSMGSMGPSNKALSLWVTLPRRS